MNGSVGPSVRLSVRLFVCLTVTPFWLCSHRRITMKFSAGITNDRSDVQAKFKVRGHRSRSQRSNYIIFITALEIPLKMSSCGTRKDVQYHWKPTDFIISTLSRIGGTAACRYDDLWCRHVMTLKMGFLTYLAFHRSVGSIVDLFSLVLYIELNWNSMLYHDQLKTPLLFSPVSIPWL